MATQKTWKDWFPGIDNDDKTLGELLQTLPGNPPGDIHWLVRLIENPKSRFHLPGAVDLYRHDCIHIILGRGLLAQDEAFVVGFTMGAASNIKPWHRHVFKFVARFLYPRIYRLKKRHLQIYDMAFDMVRQSACRDIQDVDFKSLENLTLGEIRHRLGIDKSAIKASFAREIEILPKTKASQRLIA